MQSAKDSFYLALKQRLTEVNPERAITLDGEQQPAIFVTENQPVTCAELPPDCFFLSFGAAQAASEFARAPQPVMALSCTIAYFSRGSAIDGRDRGRALSALDAELLQFCEPPRAGLFDCTQSPPLRLPSSVFWLQPQLQAVEDDKGSLRRSATLTLFYTPEVTA